MKKMMLTLIAIMAVTLQANALSKSRSRQEARFLTDKMAYELDLTDEQLQDIYEINYDYFRSLGPVSGNYDRYYDLRYTNLSYVLYDWQWREFLLREYFLRPVYIYRGGWAFGIYNYYARTHFFFGVPHAYNHYHGGHFRTHNYYLNRRDMHHRAVAARPRPNIVDRRPQMTRPNVRQHKGVNKPGNQRGIEQRIQPNKGNNNVARPNAPTRSNNAGRNGNVNRTPAPSQNKGNASRGNSVSRNNSSSRSNTVTRSTTPPRSSSATRSGGNVNRSAGQSTRNNDSGRGRR